MKTIILFALLLIASCDKRYCECQTIYDPIVKKPVVFLTDDPAYYHGKSGTYADEFGNVITWRTICFKE